MAIEILNNDLTPLEGLEITGLEAGQESDTISFALRNSGGEDRFDELLVIQVEDPLRPGTYVSSGIPPQDELWCRVRLTGQDAAAAPAQQPYVTGWQPIGAFSGLLIPTLLSGGIRFGELKMRVPASASPMGYRWALSTLGLEHARAVPPSATATRRGILCRLGDFAATEIVRGFEVTVSSPPDDEIHVAAGALVHLGIFRNQLATSLTLSQADGAGAPLADGESYWAAISVGAGAAVATKGTKAANPVRPAVPAGSAPLLWVRVEHQAGGTSSIEAADLLGDVVRGRYFAEAGAGLELRIHAGQALGGASWRYHSSPQLLPLEPGATNHVWQLASGDFEVTAAPNPPEAAALGPWWEADTDADGVTALRDRRTYTEDTLVVHLGGAIPGAPGSIASQLVFQDLAVETIVYRLSDNGGGASGETRLDLLINGTTTYTSQATDDQRPAWPFDAAVLIDGDGIHELTRLRPGDEIELVSINHPAGGVPARAEAWLVCRRAS